MEFKIFGATIKLNSAGDLLAALAFSIVVGLSLLSFGWLPQFGGFAYAETVKKAFEDAKGDREVLRDEIISNRKMLETSIQQTNKDTLSFIVRSSIIGMRERECELRRLKNPIAADLIANAISDLQVEFHSYKGIDYPTRSC